MKNSRRLAPASKQQGFSLFAGLMILVLMTILAISAFRVGINETMVVANAQHRNEAIDAAQQVIDMVASSNNFTQNPAAAVPNSNCTGGGANSWCVDNNADGVNDVKVQLNPEPDCVAASVIPASQLDLTQAADLTCAAGVQQNFGVVGAVSGDSMCANSTWEISAQANDTATGTTATVAQGINVRIAATDMATYCP